MTLSTAQKKLLHTIIGGVAAAGGYLLVNALPIGPDLKLPLLALCVAAVIRAAGALLAKVETQPPGPPA
jgi:hypothetical protein